MSDGTYIIDFICETAVDFTVLFESHSEHNYGEIYSPHNNTHHKSKCECDMYLLEVHVCKANLNPKYGTCVKCGATVNLGIGPGIIGPTVYHEGKKCVILNNGVLLIIDDDISVER